MLFMVLEMVETPEDIKKVEALYQKYDRLMYYTAAKILGNHQDVEDAVMDAWMRIIRNLDKISEISCPKTLSYLVIIVRRASINILNRNKKRGDREVPIDEQEKALFFATDDPGFDNAEVMADLQSIPTEYGESLILYYMNEMSVEEISKLLGISEMAVYKRLQRGREALEERWTK